MTYASRRSSYIMGSLGATIQILAGWWDVYSHILFPGVDPWWNPAHLTLYTGIAIMIIAVWRGLRARPAQPTPAMVPIKFMNTAGLRLAAVGTVIEIVAGVWNEIVHRVVQSEPRIAPAHALLVVGMTTVAFGMVIGLTIEHGMIKRGFIPASALQRWTTLFCLILTFTSIWLAAAGAFVYLAGAFRAWFPNLVWAVMLSIIAPLVLVPAKRVLPRLGTMVSIAIIFNGVTFFFLVLYLQVSPYIPWGLTALFLFDLLVAGLNRVMITARAVLVASTVTGILFGVTYYPFTMYLFPWSLAPSPLVGVVFVGWAAGTILGNKVYAKVTSTVLGSVA